MLPLLCLRPDPTSLFFTQSITYPLHIHRSFFRCKVKPQFHRKQFPVSSISSDPSQFTQTGQHSQQRRTLYPGGFKRPEIKVPNVVLQVDVNGVLGGGDLLDLVDDAVSKWVGIVVLDGGEGSGGKLYEAASLLKSKIRDRAYLLIAERADIAAAVNASGVLLSDQGLPAIVARNMMIDSKSESVVLPLVARNVASAEAALNASISEGADFLVYDIREGGRVDEALHSVLNSVKIPIFISFVSCREGMSVSKALKFLIPGTSGLAFSVKNLELLGEGVLSKLLNTVYTTTEKMPDENESFDKLNGFPGTNEGCITARDREKQFIERERSVLVKAINVIRKAAPLMEEVSLLTDAVSRLDEPFLLAIVGEFNSGKSTVINALLGTRYLNEGVVPTTNEITFLRYSDLSSGELQHCERNLDGQYVCFLPAPILKEIHMVDTPGTNVILQRQQRLTEEFVPRADLLLFVLSADRPLTESEVTFLRYIQQWKKKIVFVLNKADIYQNARELEEAVSFIKENAKKLLNTEHITVYPVSARAALEAKLAPFASRTKSGKLPDEDSSWRFNTFYELEEFLHSFLDASTSNGMERTRLKLETPVAIAERLLSSCETLVRQDCQYMKKSLTSIKDLVSSVAEYAMKMDRQSISYRRQILSLIDTTKSRILEQIESTVQLSNFDVVASYLFRGEKSSLMPATSKVLNDIIRPALSDSQKILEAYVTWLKSNNTREGRLYKEAFEERCHSLASPDSGLHLETYEMLKEVDELSLRAIGNFNPVATSKIFEREIREVFLGTFGGLGASGLSASLLTSVLPTTLEDLLALGISSAGGFLAISRFPAQRQELAEKVKKAADVLATDLEEAMRKDLLQAIGNMENFVKTISKPCEEEAQNKLDTLLEIRDELSDIEEDLRTLQIEIQNLHVS